MADRVIENSEEEVPEIPETLERVMIFALEEAKEKMLQEAEVVPFTVLVVKENLFIETHPGDSTEESYAGAIRTVEGARGASAYAFCYDGYLETDEEALDALIAEGGIPGEDKGFAIGFLYKTKNEEVTFEDDPVYIGEAPNFMADLKDLEYEDEEETEDENLQEDSLK